MIADHEARRAIAEDLDTTLVVEAAAGTGKTTALVGRIVAAIRQGKTELAKIVAVTFTDTAAGELKLRIRGEIENARQSASALERDRLEAALPQLEEARIATIHSLCADLLRERPIEAEIDPRFQVAAEDVKRQLFSQAFDGWFEARLSAPSDGMRRILRRRARGEDTPRQLLYRAAWDLSEWRDHATP
ncbi:MAG: ATP-dependent deoxyribonuclease subunit A, partial [Armatimonadetes bacterium]|nr:ATP-dependent deoxyribonuclease subunit A [Armatimonadota bacterium]